MSVMHHGLFRSRQRFETTSTACWKAKRPKPIENLAERRLINDDGSRTKKTIDPKSTLIVIFPQTRPFTALTKAAKRHLTSFCRYANHVLTLCCDQNKLVTCLLLILLYKGFSSDLKHIQEGENFHQLDNKVVFGKSERLLSSPGRLLRQSTTHNIGRGTADWKASYCW